MKNNLVYIINYWIVDENFRGLIYNVVSNTVLEDLEKSMHIQSI